MSAKEITSATPIHEIKIKFSQKFEDRTERYKKDYVKACDKQL